MEAQKCNFEPQSAPTVNYGPEQISKIPLLVQEVSTVNALVENNIHISKFDWDSFESSWDFTEHPLVRLSKDLWDATAVGASMSYYYGGHPKVGSPVELCYRVYFISENNEKISNENIVIADKKDKDTAKRMFRLRFSFKNKKYNKAQRYYLVAYDDKNDIEVLRHEIIMDIAFADDFGFFE